jgi:hypothetical protein
MSEAMTNGGAMSRSEDGLVAYTVVVKRVFVLAEGPAAEAWQDVATVRVPPRTKRRTIIEKGLAGVGIEKSPELEARLLGGDSESDDPSDAAYIWRARPPEPAALRLT